MIDISRLKVIVCCVSAFAWMWACTFDTSGLKKAIPTTCGNGIVDPGELCDSQQLNQQTCETLGFLSGTLACALDCNFDTSHCQSPTCGDGIREGMEVCDGADLDEQTCKTQGFFGGILLCSEDCKSFDTSSCTLCGNGILDSGETCDGTQLNGKTCENFGFFTGTLTCMPNCLGVNTTQCTNCGNDRLDLNEVCDGTRGIGQSCLDQGCRSGVVTCASDCGSLIFSNCYDGHDEDADGRDDNCDNCPTVPNNLQENDDFDTIGDVCEAKQNPTLLNDIVFFDPFTSALNSWTDDGGQWTYDSDTIQGEPELGSGNYYYDIRQLPDSGYSVETTVYFTTDPNNLDFNPYAAVTFGWRKEGLGGTLSDAWACAWKRKENKVSLLQFNLTWYEKASQSVTTSAGNYEWRRIRADVSAEQITCSYTDVTMMDMVTATYSRTLSDDLHGNAGVRINDTSAVFTSFIIYGMAPETTK